MKAPNNPPDELIIQVTVKYIIRDSSGKVTTIKESDANLPEDPRHMGGGTHGSTERHHGEDVAFDVLDTKRNWTEQQKKILKWANKNIDISSLLMKFWHRFHPEVHDLDDL